MKLWVKLHLVADYVMVTLYYLNMKFIVLKIESDSKINSAFY